MSDQMSASGTRSSSEQVSGWAAGWALFAGIMMVMIGTFDAIEGLVALFNDKFYVVTPHYVFEADVTTWGWVHLLVGVLVGVAGFFVFSGQLWARIVGIVAAVVSAIANFLYIPYYPLWSLLIIAMDVAVIWALCKYSRTVAENAWL